MLCVMVLCQARYSMGNARVGRLQYNDTQLDCALVHVDIHPLSDSGSSYCFSPIINIPQPNTVNLTKSESPTEENGSSVNDLEPANPVADLPSGLRKRNVFPTDRATSSRDHPDETSLADDMKKLAINREKPKKDDCDGCKPTTTQDPLHWFGILVPMPLRQSQAAFRHAIDIVCNIASLQTQLLDIRKQYHAVLKAKRHLSALATVVEDS